jgi:uncharacterized cysteine cluster protein YcgN (CxxCxxCC family)
MQRLTAQKKLSNDCVSLTAATERFWLHVVGAASLVAPAQSVHTFHHNLNQHPASIKGQQTMPKYRR